MKHISVLPTDLLPSIVVHKIYDMRLARSPEEIAKVVDVDESYIRDVLGSLDHEGEDMQIMVRHPVLPEFMAEFTISGVHGNALHGYAESDDATVQAVLNHIEDCEIVDEPEIMAMHLASDRYSIAILRINNHGVELVIASFEEDENPDEETIIDELLSYKE